MSSTIAGSQPISVSCLQEWTEPWVVQSVLWQSTTGIGWQTITMPVIVQRACDYYSLSPGISEGEFMDAHLRYCIYNVIRCNTSFF